MHECMREYISQEIGHQSIGVEIQSAGQQEVW